MVGEGSYQVLCQALSTSEKGGNERVRVYNASDVQPWMHRDTIEAPLLLSNGTLVPWSYFGATMSGIGTTVAIGSVWAGDGDQVRFELGECLCSAAFARVLHL
jgi:hypothetical protein